MSLKEDAWPSSAAFDLIADALKNDAERKAAMKQAPFIFGFTLKNDKNETKSWYIDLKKTGSVGKDKTAPEGETAVVTLSLKDVDFAKLVSGKGKPQQMFMTGKLKLQGDMMKATKIEPILQKVQTKAKL
ncbi:hypothetical protein BAUCODRAFT_30942 [Baudoinia panamericana UAMH 10762]|uniref:SCP2 domain-containing protein n=1 Tax=Baudoinia panamericana (strain UAMH 10762) TaxID=717646 RepID=M2N3W7_BAUPA|nr:uncharacterized protein BAUCODRAFT_30942 [Baudoinia panamericana UAMH 10762]EMC98678.1 hypothetical protein BAUCODRAFT_30942 [Baudoinia panamericana UAMH 10762]